LPLNLPNLDDLRWIDLVEEGRALIPAYAPDWTNHNPSDPGITLMELLAYASERLMYQTNRITPQHMIEFLQLIKGEKITEKSPHELTREKRKVVRALQESTRAVTAKDFENLARTVDGMNEGDAEGRAICLPSSNLESQDPAEQNAHAPGHFTVIVIPARKSHIPTRDLLVRVKNRLEPARLLTTRIHVVGPQYVNLGVQLTLVLRRGVPADEVRNKVLDRIRTFFELYQLLGDIEGIEFVRRSKDVAGVLMDEFFLKPPTSPSPSRLKRSLRDELEAVELLPFELIAVTVASEDIAVASQA
jgi:hypothetical protein